MIPPDTEPLPPIAGMITPAFVRTIAAYNAEMNRRFYSAAAGLSDEARRLPRGAFWGSIHGTFCHLLWADRIWMSRLDGWDKPELSLKDSDRLIADFDELSRARVEADRAIASWAERLREGWLTHELVWFSSAASREIRQRRDRIVVHVFNHQTHHRGQVHAMLTAAGAQTGDTDLFLVV